MHYWKTKIAAVSLAVMASFGGGLLAGPGMADVKQLNKLPGRWKGEGLVEFDGGANESIRCIATYFVKERGKSLQQNLRCSTAASYKISARSELGVRGDDLTGKWEERNTGNEGSVTGLMTAGGFDLLVTGKTFTAAMNVNVTTKCSQQIEIAPTGLGVKLINIELRKC